MKKNSFISLFLFRFYSNARIKINSYDSLPLEKTLMLHNAIIFIKSVFYIRIKITTIAKNSDNINDKIIIL